MRLAVVLLAAAAPAVSWAQPAPPVTATPLPPTMQYTKPQSPPPAVQMPAPSPGMAPAGPKPSQATWVPQGSAQLQVLDKVNAQNAVLNVKVGQEAQFGSLNIQVQACDIRAPDQPQDSAAYLAITDSHADAPGFRGWMLANNPSLSMLEHPVYDVRVIGCRA